MISVFGRDLQVRRVPAATFEPGLVEMLLRSTCPTNLFLGGMDAPLMAED